MDLLTLVLTLAVVGFLVWLLLTYIPMAEPFKKVIIVVVVLVLILWVLQQLGWTGPHVTLR